MNIEEEKFNPGAIVKLPTDSDYVFGEQIAGGTPEFNWNIGYDIEDEINFKVPIKDQGISSSCGGQAWAYLGEALSALNNKKYVEKSAKFIYAQTHVPGGGSDGLTNCKLVIRQGWGNEADCPSYENSNAPSEAFITSNDITAIAKQNAMKDKAIAYAQVPLNIDIIAQAIRDQHGVIIGIDGQNNGTWRTAFPKPPVPGQVWSHWVRCGKAKLIDGKKMIGFSNSWNKNTGDRGWQWVGEDYINSFTVIGSYSRPCIWSLWTMIYDKQDSKPLFTRNLFYGSRGEDVKVLQGLLKIPQDGIFGKITLSHVKLFQSLHSLKVDGIVGKFTQSSLLTLNH